MRRRSSVGRTATLRTACYSDATLKGLSRPAERHTGNGFNENEVILDGYHAGHVLRRHADGPTHAVFEDRAENVYTPFGDREMDAVGTPTPNRQISNQSRVYFGVVKGEFSTAQYLCKRPDEMRTRDYAHERTASHHYHPPNTLAAH